MAGAWRLRRLALLAALSAAISLAAGGAALANMSAAKSRVFFAEDMLSSGRGVKEIEDKLKEAERFLEEESAADKAPLLERIKAIRARLAAQPKPLNISAVRTNVSQARTLIEYGQAGPVEDKLKAAEELLVGVTDPRAAELRADIAKVRGELRARLGDPRVAEALGRAAGRLDALDRRLAGDPYGDVDPAQAERIRAELDALLAEARAALDGLPANDAEVAAALARIDGAAVKLGHAAEAWHARQEAARLAEEKKRAEAAAAEAARAAERERRSAEAEAAWRRIEAALAARDDFRPEAAASFAGQTIRLKAVRNRAASDFDGEYPFAAWLGQAVLAGFYEPKVAAALDEATRLTGTAVDDRLDWEVIAVVEGAGTIKRRVVTELVDSTRRVVVGRTESYEPMDCVRIKVVALRAGPVVAGP